LVRMKADDFSRFNEDVVKWVEEVPSLNDLNKCLASVSIGMAFIATFLLLS
jgi:hypothetical protein